MPALELQIIDILENKLFVIRSPAHGDLYHQQGRHILIEQLQHAILNNRPIELLVPGFPCKSPNLNKVCGKLPDAGELYALEYLNSVCREISLIYQHGCHLRLWSDGRIFADLIGVPREDIARYESLLRSHTHTMTHIAWDNLDQYITSEDQVSDDLVNNYATRSFDVDHWLAKSDNNRKQFLHMKSFMSSDLTHTKIIDHLSTEEEKQTEIDSIVRMMIKRNDALTNLLKQHYPHHIRLSVHQHSNNGDKFTIHLLPSTRQQTSEQPEGHPLRTPWHHVPVIQIDGTLHLIPHQQIDLQSQHLPLRCNDHIWCFFQLPQPLTSFSSSLTLSMLSDSPRFGLAIDLHDQLDAFQLDVNWMKMLMQKFGFVVLRRCNGAMDRERYAHFCEQFSSLVMWNTGPVFTIKPEANPDSTHTSREALPLHFDLSYPPEYLAKSGLYEDYVPQYFMLYCVKAPTDHAGGKTNLVNGRLLLESASVEEIERWKNTHISNSVPKTYYGGRTYTYPMIMSHPKTGESILRYLKPSGSRILKVTGHCSVDGEVLDAATFEEFSDRMKKLMRDPRWYLEHTWNDGDIVLIENHHLLHGRTQIDEETERELWRVQVY